jgi:ribonuclease Z
MDDTSYVFDAGEGSTDRLRSCNHGKLQKVRGIFITHLHGDHVQGLGTFLQAWRSVYRESCSKDQNPERIAIFGPVGIMLHLQAAFLTVSVWQRQQLPFDVFELVPPGYRSTSDLAPNFVSPKSRELVPPAPSSLVGQHAYVYPEADGTYLLVDEKDHTVIAAPIQHSTACFGYVVSEKPRRPRLLPEKAIAAGVTPGPDFAVLCAEGQITLSDGRVVRLDEVGVHESLPRKVVILGDNCGAPALEAAAQNADVSGGQHVRRCWLSGAPCGTRLWLLAADADP